MQQKTPGRQCFVTGWINNNNRFYLEDNVCFKQSNGANQLEFTNISKKTNFLRYMIFFYKNNYLKNTRVRFGQKV